MLLEFGEGSPSAVRRQRSCGFAKLPVDSWVLHDMLHLAGSRGAMLVGSSRPRSPLEGNQRAVAEAAAFSSMLNVLLPSSWADAFSEDQSLR